MHLPRRLTRSQALELAGAVSLTVAAVTAGYVAIQYPFKPNTACLVDMARRIDAKTGLGPSLSTELAMNPILQGACALKRHAEQQPTPAQ